LTYNENRNSWYINGQLVTRKRLNNLKINNMNNKLIIMSLLFAIFATSCSARKVQKSETKEDLTITEVATKKETTEQTKETETNVKVTTTSEINTENNLFTETTTIEPIDNSKPASTTDRKGNKVDLTNAKHTTTKITDLSKSNEKVNTLYEENKKELEAVKKELNEANSRITKLERKIDIKNTEIDGIKWWWWLILIVILYLFYRFIRLNDF